MNEEQFRQILRARGYDEPAIMESEPGSEREMHCHDRSNLSLVLSGEFTLVQESGAKTYGPGDCCENEAGTLHTERIGLNGVTVLVAYK